MKHKKGLYEKYFKRIFDLIVSSIALVILTPLLIVLIVVGAIMMKGNPFFVQERPGIKDKHGNEKIFKLIKFRTMTNERDKEGKLLPDQQRLNKYGKFLRSTSLDELPELINIFTGTLSCVGPRPLLPEYIPYYTEEERRRHDVRPGLTGWAQVNGRNNINSWEERFQYDLEYVQNCSFVFDMKILFLTVIKVIKRSDILVGNEIKVGRLDDARKVNLENENQIEKI